MPLREVSGHYRPLCRNFVHGFSWCGGFLVSYTATSTSKEGHKIDDHKILMPGMCR
jgi:hypothetical protein